MPFAHQDVLEVRQRWVVCCYKRQNFLSHVLGLFWSRLAFSELTLAPNRSRVSGRVKSNAVVSPTVSIKQVTVPPSQVLCREGTQLLNLITLCLVERKGQVCADKWAAFMHVMGFGSQRAVYVESRNIWFSWSQFGADPSIIRQFIELRVEMVRWPCNQSSLCL